MKGFKMNVIEFFGYLFFVIFGYKGITENFGIPILIWIIIVWIMVLIAGKEDLFIYNPVDEYDRL